MASFGALGGLGVWDMVSPSPRPSSRRPAPHPRWGGPHTLAPLWGFGVPAVPIRQPFPSLPPRSHQLAAPFPSHSQHLWGGGSRWGPSCQLIPQRGSSRPPLAMQPLPGARPPGGPPPAARGRPHLSPAAAPGSGTRALCASGGLEGGQSPTKPPSPPPAPTQLLGEPEGHPGEGWGVPGAECSPAAAGFGLFQQLPAARGMLLGPGHGVLHKLFIGPASPGAQRLHSSRSLVTPAGTAATKRGI